jgi:hypothetical protein
MTYAANRQAKKENEAFHRGQLDYKLGKARAENPYSSIRSPRSWEAWNEGWEDIAEHGA